MPSTATGSLLRLVQESRMQADIQAFIIDCQSRGLSPRTIEFYEDELRYLRTYLEAQHIRRVEDITPTHLRAWFLELGKTRNPGGIHCSYRVTKTFLRWWESEYEPRDWKNPILKVRAPKLPKLPVTTVPLDDVRALLAACPRRQVTGDRNRAIILALLDTGCRAGEFLALNIGDVTMSTGAVLVRKGKGNKARVVFLGAKARKALITYLRHRPDAKPKDPLWLGENGRRLSYRGLDSALRRCAQRANISEPALHSFRRTFATLSHDNGADIIDLQRLMGHADLSILRRYLGESEAELRATHERSGPVDNLL